MNKPEEPTKCPKCGKNAWWTVSWRNEQMCIYCIRDCFDHIEAENEKLKGVVDKLPSQLDTQQSIRCIQKSIQSHESWREYRLKGGKGDDMCGHLKHHETCLAEYAQVMQTLTAMDAAAR